MISRRRPLVAIASAVAAVSLPTAAVRAVEVDFGTFTTLTGVPAATLSAPNWQVLGVTPGAPSTYNNIPVAPGRVAQEITNANTTLFLGPSTLTTMNKIITGDIYFGADDDYVGLALGVPQDPFSNVAADYLLLQWKGATQTFDFHDTAGAANFHNTTVGGSAPAGVSLSHVTGVPTNDDIWQRAQLQMYDPQGKDTPDPNTDPPIFDTGGLVELGRGAVSGTRAYDRSGKRTTFEVTYTPTNINIKINGLQEFSLDAPAGQTFPEGTLAMYEQAQSDNSAYAYWDVRELADPPPPPGPNLGPSGPPFAAADLSVPAAHSNAGFDAASTWTVVRTGTSPSDMTVVRAPTAPT